MKALGLAFLLAFAACDSPVNHQLGHRPEQPIAFSHALHAGLYELDCQYCHSNAERSRHAGVPPAGVCMNCHAQVKTSSPEIAKLTRFVDEDRPPPWIKVHRLPDHVFFSHASHVGAQLACGTCHGDVQHMVRVEQVETMQMGWCIDCHRKTRAERRDAPAPLATLPMDTLSHPERIATRTLAPPLDCSGCHR